MVMLLTWLLKLVRLWTIVSIVWYIVLFNIIWCIFVSNKIGNQPTRKNLNYIMAGDCNIFSRFRYLEHLNKLKKHLPPCKSFFTKMIENLLFLKSYILCTYCVNWDMMIKSPLMSFDPPKHYPKCMFPDDKKVNQWKYVLNF